MKNMKKLVAALAAATMVMSMGFSAFAEVITPGKVVDEDGAMTHITFVVDGEDISKSSESQITLLAYLIPEKDSNGDAYTAGTIPAYSNQTIVALNQVGGSAGFGQIPVDTEKLEAGYAIAVNLGGSDGTVAQGIITYSSQQETINVSIADINADDTVNVDDMNAIIVYIKNNLAHPTYSIGANIAGSATKLGDVTGDGVTNVDDMNAYIVFIKNNLTHPSINFNATVEVPKQ